MALEAETIITGDKEMLKLKEFRGILILTPKEFLSRFKETRIT
jgi:predicted nucleic acid-binding protein